MWECIWSFKKDKDVLQVYSVTNSSVVLSVWAPSLSWYSVCVEGFVFQPLFQPPSKFSTADKLRSWEEMPSDRLVEVKGYCLLFLTRNTWNTGDGIVLSGHSCLQNNSMAERRKHFSIRARPTTPTTLVSVRSVWTLPLSFGFHIICWNSIEGWWCSSEIEHLASNHEVVGLISWTCKQTDTQQQKNP